MSDDTRNNGTATGKVGPGNPPVEHRFKPGNPGRPKGSRNKLGEQFLEDLLASWEKHGMSAIERVIAEKPEQYLKVVASILPKEFHAEVTERYVARIPEPATSVEGWMAEYAPKAPKAGHH